MWFSTFILGITGLGIGIFSLANSRMVTPSNYTFYENSSYAHVFSFYLDKTGLYSKVATSIDAIHNFEPITSPLSVKQEYGITEFEEFISNQEHSLTKALEDEVRFSFADSSFTHEEKELENILADNSLIFGILFIILMALGYLNYSRK